MTSQWQEISAKAKQKVLDDIPSEWRIPTDKVPGDDVLDVTGIPAQCGLLSQLDLEITESFATEIVAKIAKGEWSAEAVTTAFCKRASIAHQLTNCLTVIMFDSAIARAKDLDIHFQKTGKVSGPLHGLPISLKDNFNIPGFPSSVGFASWATESMQQESTIVTTLRNLGAVAYVKTNVPTAMMIAESVNNVYGRTLNPQNRSMTSGGSSGGESALISMRGSPLGVGTDIGGSLRIPAACTGIFTIRPSYGRFPHFDARSGLSGQEAVASVNGPMARSVADIRLWAESVVGTKPWLRDPKCVPGLEWRHNEDARGKVKIGVLWDNGMVQPTPPVKRALKETVEKLKAKGYEIIDWPATDHAEAMELLGRFFVSDGGKSIEKILKPVDEPWRPEMKGYEDAGEIGVHELWQLQSRRTALCKRYLDRWEAAGLDAILGPTTPYATTKNGEFRHVGYTGVFNILDYSSTSFPCGVTVDKEKDLLEPGIQIHDELDAQTQREYDAEVAHGMPVSLQLTGRRLEEEKMLALTERVVEDLKG
ncbi:related to general amidase [Ramularia collo-cygni]|uniref:amidase n=1 Tax=Ramularia collo-cygni TaxID=112498 RepID=A0A2D3UXL5_9PEZI|nr:related to general amidase [Ramularia collo-cygni]CZT21591.1 related to general amidase [Ramularia collo-cygni]